jgi:hypothetical protein
MIEYQENLFRNQDTIIREMKENAENKDLDSDTESFRKMIVMANLPEDGPLK